MPVHLAASSDVPVVAARIGALLLLGSGLVGLLLPTTAWNWHVWSMRRKGITQIERTPEWEHANRARALLAVLMSVFFFVIVGYLGR